VNVGGVPLRTDPRADQAPVRLRYLGCAGFVVESRDRTLVLDPFVTRTGVLRTLTRPLRSDPDLVRRLIPKADDVLIGHAHFDHILDAPEVCRQTGARLIGSPSTCNVGRAAGLPESQLIETRGGEEIACGAARVRGVPSLHGKVALGRVPLPGQMTAPPPWPPRFYHLKCGLVLNWWMEIGGVRVVHIDSAELIADELEAVQADVLCLCAVGFERRPDYVEKAISILKPKVVVACHWDWFFSHFDAPPRLLPNLNLAAFVAEVERFGVSPWVLPLGGSLGLAA